MLSFLADQDIAVVFDLTLSDLTATALEYRVVDHDGEELVARASTAYTPGDQTKTITVPAALNALPVGVVAAARTVYLYITGTGGAAGEVRLSQSYRIVAEDDLPVPSASFQSLASADMIAADLLDVTAYTGASDSDRAAALRQARDNLCQLHFRFEVDKQRASYGIGGGVFERDGFDLGEVTLSELNALPAEFRSALKRAQVLDAAWILGRLGDDVAAQRDQGLVSITIGESSRTYTRQKPPRSAASPRAVRVLSAWLAPLRVVRA